MKFYDNSISTGTKIDCQYWETETKFYDNSISTGTKMCAVSVICYVWFYDNSISTGTKIGQPRSRTSGRFTITQFLQVLKCQIQISG